MLRKKAAEELKKEQERKAAERRRIIEQRCGKPRDLESANEGKITSLSCNMHLDRYGKRTFYHVILTMTKLKTEL